VLANEEIAEKVGISAPQGPVPRDGDEQGEQNTRNQVPAEKTAQPPAEKNMEPDHDGSQAQSQNALGQGGKSQACEHQPAPSGWIPLPGIPPHVSQNGQGDPEAQNAVGHGQAPEDMRSRAGGEDQSAQPGCAASVQGTADPGHHKNGSPGGENRPHAGGEFRFPQQLLAQGDQPVKKGGFVEVAGPVEMGRDVVPAHAHFSGDLGVHGFAFDEGVGAEIGEKEKEGDDPDPEERATKRDRKPGRGDSGPAIRRFRPGIDLGSGRPGWVAIIHRFSYLKSGSSRNEQSAANPKKNQAPGNGRRDRTRETGSVRPPGSRNVVGRTVDPECHRALGQT